MPAEDSAPDMRAGGEVRNHPQIQADQLLEKETMPDSGESGHISTSTTTEAVRNEGNYKEDALHSPSQEPSQEELKAEQAVAPSDGGEVQRIATNASTASKRLPLDQQPLSKRLVIMGALCMAVFLAALDMTIVSTALPTIAQDFQISQADYTWVGSAYLLACAAATPPWGKISDIFGRKPILLFANFLFFVGSLICGVAVNINMLIAGRVVQGIGGGGLLTLVNICIGDLFSMRSRGAYYGMVGGVWAIAGAIGPILGGAFTEYVSWRWCFYINLPCDGIAFAILIFFLKIETPTTAVIDGLKAIDWLGLVLSVGGTVMFLFGLEYGGVTDPWNSPMVVCLLVFGVLTMVLFCIVEWKVAKYPLMPLRLFRTRNALVSFATAFFHGQVFMAGSYYLPLYFQAVQGATPLLSGVYQFPFILPLSLTSVGTGFYIRKTGRSRPPIWFGMFFMALGFGLLIDLPSDSNWARIAPFQIIAGLGVGPIFQAPLITLQSTIQPKDMATGTATFAFVRQLSSSISLVVGGVIFQNEMFNHYSTLRAVLDQQTTAILAQGSAGASVGLIRGLPAHAATVVKQVYTQSLQTMWIYYTAMGVVGFFVCLLLQKKALSKTHEVRKQGLAQQEKDRQEELAETAEKKERKRKSKRIDRDVEAGKAFDKGTDAAAAAPGVGEESEKGTT